MAAPSETSCPECGHTGLVVKEVFVADYRTALAGLMPKFGAKKELRWYCPAVDCDATGTGEWVED